MAPGSVIADQVTLKWDVVTGADTYKIYMSADLGVTWTLLTATSQPPYVAQVDGTKLLLFRVASVKGGGETASDWRGAWYNGTWNQQPSNLSVK